MTRAPQRALDEMLHDIRFPHEFPTSARGEFLLRLTLSKKQFLSRVSGSRARWNVKARFGESNNQRQRIRPATLSIVETLYSPAWLLSSSRDYTVRKWKIKRHPDEITDVVSQGRDMKLQIAGIMFNDKKREIRSDAFAFCRVRGKKLRVKGTRPMENISLIFPW